MRAVRIFGQVRPGDRAVDLAEVNVDNALIFCVGVGLERCPGAVHAALNIGARHVVDGENAVFAARLDGHVADRQAVVDREVLDALAGKFDGLVACAVHADHADERQDDVLAGDKRAELAGEIHLDGGRDLEPRLARGHGRTHVGRADAGGECAERAVGAGVRVRADDGLARGDKPLLGQQRVLDAHRADIVKMVDVEAAGEGAALLALRGGLDVLVRCEVIHHHRNAALVEDFFKARGFKFVDGHGGRDVVAEDEVELCLDELARAHALKSCVLGENFLRHCHAHVAFLLSVAGFHDLVDAVDVGADRRFDDIGREARAGVRPPVGAGDLDHGLADGVLAVRDGVQAEALELHVHLEHAVDGLERGVQRARADGDIFDLLVAALELDARDVRHAVARVDHMAHEPAAALHRGLAVEHERLNVAARDVLFLVGEILEAGEHAFKLLVAQFVAHGFELFTQRVLAGVLAEHHRVLRDADVGGVHDLVRSRVGDDAVLMDA